MGRHYATRPHHPVATVAATVAVTLPAALLVMMFDSIGKDPIGSALPAVVSSALGLLAERVARRLDPNVPRYALSAGLLVAFVSSFVAFVIALVWVIP